MIYPAWPHLDDEVVFPYRISAGWQTSKEPISGIKNSHFIFIYSLTGLSLIDDALLWTKRSPGKAAAAAASEPESKKNFSAH